MAALDLLLGRRDGDEVHLDASWTNSWGVVFGGTTTAALLDRWLADLAPDGDHDGPPRLRSAHLAFERPATVDRPIRVESGVAAAGRSVTRLDGVVRQIEPTAETTGGRTLVRGFAVAARDGGASTAAAPTDPAIPLPAQLEEAPGDERTADVIRHHFELRVVPRLRDGEPVVRQWVRFRHLEGPPPLAAVGLLADLVSVGVFRTAARELEGVPVVSSLDLGLHLTGVPLGGWTLMTMATPPIRDGGAVAHATLHDEDGRHVATATQQVLVRPLHR